MCICTHIIHFSSIYHILFTRRDAAQQINKLLKMQVAGVWCPPQLCLLVYKLISSINCRDTVDGGNPAPVDF